VGYLEKLIALLRAMGTPGLFALAFLDSAGLPTGGGPDMLILLLAAHDQAAVRLLTVAPVAVLGSTLGCLVFYGVGRRGGEPVLARFAAEKRARIIDRIERYGLWAIVVAVVMPPPYPMKLFVLSAGVFRMSLKDFVSAVLIGRTARYFTVGYLAVRYGEQAGALLRAHYPAAVGTLAALVGLLLLARWQWQRRRGTT